jgi:heme/copper-type cytochrome/quinol oxidase subunit 2
VRTVPLSNAKDVASPARLHAANRLYIIIVIDIVIVIIVVIIVIVVVIIVVERSREAEHGCVRHVC